MPHDSAVRGRALDPSASFIVQAPAGSGKTELLIQRYLKLLARVDSPESVVAITFTKKASGEMRARVVQSLRAAAVGITPEDAQRSFTYRLAQDVLARDAQAAWGLVENPARLHIRTIDSLSASITRQMPWLAQFGAPPDLTEKAAGLYREAARNTLRMAAQEESAGIEGPLSTLLLHLDNDFQRAEALIAGMLEQRDQWLRLTGVGADLQAIRAHLERTLGAVVERELASLRDALPPQAVREILLLLDLERLSDSVTDWLRVRDLILTKAGTPRKKAPADVPRERYGRLIGLVSKDPDLVAKLDDVGRLPPVRFDDVQWRTMEAVVDVLPKAVAQLQLVFRDRGVADFAELSIRASAALGRLDEPAELALALGDRIQHLLVDEFQDTSFTQFDLLRKLTAGWEPGDGRTLFLVGDPMQSIYRFREADVGLFLKARQEGLGGVSLEPLTLTQNFRSDPAIVEWVNAAFSQILPAKEDIARGAVAYASSDTSRPRTSSSAAPSMHAFPEESQAEEAARVVALAEAAEGTAAILVRARSHLAAIVPLLRQRGVPFQAIEIDALSDKPVIQDLMALTFALLEPADRVSWLAVLRAPWCGLTMADLHSLAAHDSKSPLWDLLTHTATRLSADGAARAARCRPVLKQALQDCRKIPLRTLVERTWMRLGGPACLEVDSGLADAAAYFDLLEGLETAGDLEDFGTLREQVCELFAQPDPRADGRLQIMTIHKAKGLEFDTVILPALGQRGRPDPESLLIWQEQEGELLLAPMSATGEETDPIYAYLAHLEGEKTKQENKRLLYVAATRARDRLHLTGCASAKAGGEVCPAAGSFLEMLWPLVGARFQAASPAAAVISAQGRERLRTVSRLPSGWTLPAEPPAVVWTPGRLEAANPLEVAFEWAGDALRHAGVVLHAFFERIAAEGVERWNAERIAAHGPAIRNMLASLEVPALELGEAAARVEKALTATLADQRGRWLLSSHPEAESEFALTGLLDGKLSRIKIDRTFVDEQNVRWIVDYKTSAHEGGGVENFLENEKQRYRGRLETYARLMAQTDARAIRLGLYFPLLSAWREWAAPVIRRRQASFFE